MTAALVVENSDERVEISQQRRVCQIETILPLMELVLHVEAGLTPRETLRAATYESQRMLGQEREVGTVEVGKIADLVMLDANPLEDIRNVRRVNRVIRGGVVTVVRATAITSRSPKGLD